VVVVNPLLASIDPSRAESISRKIVLAYNILDDQAAHADESDELRAEAIATGFIAQAIACQSNGIPQTEALAQFRAFLRMVYATSKRLGPTATAREVITEMHLEQMKGSER
jgi:hypothetical protein